MAKTRPTMKAWIRHPAVKSGILEITYIFENKPRLIFFFATFSGAYFRVVLIFGCANYKNVMFVVVLIGVGRDAQMQILMRF